MENPMDLICWPVWGTYPCSCEEIQGDGILRSSLDEDGRVRVYLGCSFLAKTALGFSCELEKKHLCFGLNGISGEIFEGKKNQFGSKQRDGLDLILVIAKR